MVIGINSYNICLKKNIIIAVALTETPGFQNLRSLPFTPVRETKRPPVYAKRALEQAVFFVEVV